MSHTRRRLACGMAIAVRYFPALRGRPGSPYISLWYRIGALHLEAIRAFGARGQIVNLLGTAALLPLALAAATVECLFGPAPSRAGAGADAAADGGAPAAAFLWLWVAAVLAAYVFQFRDFVRPILNLAGLA
jgi:hypothetical protein